MIVSRFIPKQGICALIVENSDDLWTLRRLISVGDTVVTKTSRVVKQEEEYSRPDRGERVKVTISLEVEGIALDRGVDRLRIKGKIIEASDESVSKAGSHSISVSPDHGLTLRKKEWNPLHTSILNSSRKIARRFLIVAIDRRGAGIGLLTGSHLTILSTVDSGVGGKMFKEGNPQSFFKNVVSVLKNSWREGDTIVLAGPGHTKLTFANTLYSEHDLGKNVSVLEGFDLADADGVRSLIKFEGFQKMAADSVLVEVQTIVNEVVRRISKGDPRVAYTLERVKERARAGAVESCVVSDDAFTHGVKEEDVVTVLNEIEQKGGRVYLVDSSLELGKQVSSFGGMFALLRYAVRA